MAISIYYNILQLSLWFSTKQRKTPVDKIIDVPLNNNNNNNKNKSFCVWHTTNSCNLKIDQRKKKNKKKNR